MEKSDNTNGLIYPEMSYKIVGCLFEVWNELGPGHLEKTYQKALSFVSQNKNIKFKEQVSSPVYFKEKLISKRYIDFVIEEKVVLEIK